MPRYAAFLRAINVGGRVVKMDRLRSLVAGAGVTNVATFIASGNVLFDSTMRSAPRLEERLERALEQGLGYRCAAFVRTAQELKTIVAGHALTGGPAGARLYVGFLKSAPDAARTRALESLSDAGSDVRVEAKELYWWLAVPMSESPLTGARLEKTLGMEVTLRNITTVVKVSTMLSAPPRPPR